MARSLGLSAYRAFYAVAGVPAIHAPWPSAPQANLVLVHAPNPAACSRYKPTSPYGFAVAVRG